MATIPLATAVVTTEGDVEFTIHPADLEHLDAAVAALKKAHCYTSSERVAYIRAFVEAHLRDFDLA